MLAGGHGDGPPPETALSSAAASHGSAAPLAPSRRDSPAREQESRGVSVPLRRRGGGGTDMGRGTWRPTVGAASARRAALVVLPRAGL